MNKYLEKIAEKGEEPKRKNPGTEFGKAYGALIAGGVGKVPVALLSNYTSRKIRATINDTGVSDHGTIKKFMRDNNLHKNVTFNTREHMKRREKLDPRSANTVSHSNVRGAPGYIYNPSGGRGFIAGVKKPGLGSRKTVNKDIIMHELGHAKDLQTHAKLKRVGTMIGRHPRSHGVFELATVGALSNEKTRDYAPAVAAIPGALVLREEGAANYHAYKGIKAHKGGKAANQFLKKVVSKNMASYGLAAAAPVAAAYVGKKVMDKWSPRKTEKK